MWFHNNIQTPSFRATSHLFHLPLCKSWNHVFSSAALGKKRTEPGGWRQYMRYPNTMEASGSSVLGHQPGFSELGWTRGPEGFPSDGGPEGKQSACNAGDIGDVGLILGLGRFLGEGNGNPLQYSCLENPSDRGAWWATVHRVTKSQM